MIPKASIWNYFEDPQSNIETIAREDAVNTQKVAKTFEKSILNNELTWLRSLLHPSMENKFVRAEVVDVISYGKDHFICKIQSEYFDKHNFSNLIGFFNTWWWKRSLSKLPFDVRHDLVQNFEFLDRLATNQDIVNNNQFRFYVLLHEPKLCSDQKDPNRGLVTCKKFLIIYY